MSTWKQRRQSIIDMMACYQAELDAVDALGEIDSISYIYVNGYGKTMTIDPVSGLSARDLSLQIITRLRERGRGPQMATKHLDASSGKITYTVPGPLDGWIIEVRGGDPRCKVVPVTKTRTVPAKPAVAAVAEHQEEYTVYEIANPEECGAA